MTPTRTGSFVIDDVHVLASFTAEEVDEDEEEKSEVTLSHGECIV